MPQIQSTPTGLSSVLDMLPLGYRKLAKETINTHRLDDRYINEIRLRYKRNGSLGYGGENFPICYEMSLEDIKSTMRRICDGSVYSYQSTIKEGYVPVGSGVRAGVVGEVYGDSLDIAVENITAINIRIPHHVRGVCSKLYDLFLEHNRGLIIYSPPAVGKTTLLRDLSIELSRGKKPKKVALIDTRRELDNGLIPKDCHIDTFFGYKKSQAIEIAIRTMSADVIVCDEIGATEAEAIKGALFCGVPIIAAAHASSYKELSLRNELGCVLECGVFSHAVGLQRKGRALEFDFDITAL